MPALLHDMKRIYNQLKMSRYFCADSGVITSKVIGEESYGRLYENDKREIKIINGRARRHISAIIKMMISI